MTPNRIIKERLLTSPTLSRLSHAAYGHFFSLLVLSDDGGCFECTSSVVRGKCYSRRDRPPTIKKIEVWQNEMEGCGVIRRWKVSGREFAGLMSFTTHNKFSVDEKGKSTRHRRKTPVPPKSLGIKEW